MKIILKQRTTGGYEYVTCPDCNRNITSNEPVTLDMPYCGGCGKAVWSLSHKYCGYCGGKFEEDDANV